MVKKKPVLPRKRPAKKPGRGFILGIVEYGFHICVFAALTGVALLGYVISVYSRDLPPLDPLDDYDPWSLSTQVFAADNSLIGEFYEEDRRVITIDKVPETMRRAIIAVEDQRFDRNHPTSWIRNAGVDPIGVLRAAVSNFIAGRTVQGGSTITQQLAKNLFLIEGKKAPRTLKRKVQEMLLAWRIENQYSRDEILERYLNRVFFGTQAYGIHSASLRYFGVNLEDTGATLTIGQAAMLAGLAKAPSAYAPHRHPERASERQRIVLDRMVECGYLKAGDVDSAISEFWDHFDKSRVTLSDNPEDEIKTKVAQAEHFLEFVRRELIEILGTHELYHGGYRIKTTLIPSAQIAAEIAVKDGLKRLTDEIRQRDAKLLKGGPVEGAFVALDHRTGRIIAMVGGSSWGTENQFNRAYQAKRQAGSSFKPIVYYTAMASGDATLGTVLQDWKFEMMSGPEAWSPANYGHEEFGPVLPRFAMKKSLNIASVRMMLEHTTAEAVIQTAKSIGIDISSMRPFPSLSLGSFEVSPLELTAAYGAIANDGIHVAPHAIVEIQDRLGRVVRIFEPAQASQALKPSQVFLVRSILETVVRNGTAASAVGARIGAMKAAGKTGTTDDFADAWFIGFTPDITAGAWVGFDQRRSMGRGMTGAHAAGFIWSDFLNHAIKDTEAHDFSPPPEDILSVDICSLTGLRPSSDCPEVISEYFIDRTAPTGICQVHSDRLSLLLFLYGDRLFDSGTVLGLDTGLERDRNTLVWPGEVPTPPSPPR